MPIEVIPVNDTIKQLIASKVRELIGTHGANHTSKVLGISRESAIRVAAGLGRPHSIAACGLALGVIAPVEPCP